MMSSQTTYPGMHGTIPNPYPPTSSMVHHPQQPLGFLNVGNQVHTGQVSFITSPGIFPNNHLGQENVPTVNPAPGAATSNVKDAAIALGGVQIIIGLVHIGFGVVLGLLSTSYNMTWAFYSTAFIGGYPFWGGVFFIVSGSLSISAFRKFTQCLVKSTLIINIFSIISAFSGVLMFLYDLNSNGYPYQNYWIVLSGRGIAGVLAIFSLLEFSIAGAMVHFANQTILHGNRSGLVAPTVYAANPLTQESSSASPVYDNVYASRR